MSPPPSMLAESAVDHDGERTHRVGFAPAGGPRALLVDSSLSGGAATGPVWDDVIDYRAVENVPAWIKACEHVSRLDITLAWRAKQLAPRFGVLVAGSEKVGIPLTWLRTPRPIICVVHQIASPQKRLLLKWLDIATAWTGVGYQCKADRELLISYYGIAPSRLIPFKAAPLQTFTPGPYTDGSFVLSIGTSRRDYRTFFEALDGASDVMTHVYASSRYLDPYRGRLPAAPNDGVVFKQHLDAAVMPDVYRSARFVVLPMEDTYQYSAGATVALEALAAGKAVVATRTRGMSDYVVDGVTGLLVPPGDVTAMREAIVRLWKDPLLAHEMGMAGRAHAEREFNPAIIDARIRHAYVEACEDFRFSQ